MHLKKHDTRTLKSLMEPLTLGKFDSQFYFERKVWMAYEILLIDVEPARYQHIIHEYMNNLVSTVLYEWKQLPKDLVRYVLTFLPKLCIPSCYEPISVFYYLPYPAWNFKKNKRKRETFFCPFDMIE